MASSFALEHWPASGREAAFYNIPSNRTKRMDVSALQPPDDRRRPVRTGYWPPVDVRCRLESRAPLQNPAGGAVKRVEAAALSDRAPADPSSTIDAELRTNCSLLASLQGVSRIVIVAEQGSNLAFHRTSSGCRGSLRGIGGWVQVLNSGLLETPNGDCGNDSRQEIGRIAAAWLNRGPGMRPFATIVLHARKFRLPEAAKANARIDLRSGRPA
jgi:hypothetical protein